MNKKIIIIIIVGVIVLIGLVAVLLLNLTSTDSDEATDSTTATTAPASSAVINSSGDLLLLDQNQGGIIAVTPGSNNIQKIADLDVANIQNVMWSPDGQAIVVQEKTLNSRGTQTSYIYSLQNRQKTTLDNSWVNITWINDSTIGYAVLADPGTGTTKGIYRYDIGTRQSQQILDYEGSQEDQYAMGQSLLVYVQASSDVSDSSVVVYDLRANQLIKTISVYDFSQLHKIDDNTFFVSSRSPLVIGISSDRNVSVEALSASYGTAGLYTVKDNLVYYFDIDNAAPNLNEYNTATKVSRAYNVAVTGLQSGNVIGFTVDLEKKEVYIITRSGIITGTLGQ